MKIIKSKKLNASVHLSDDGRMFMRVTDYFHNLGEGWLEYIADQHRMEGVSNLEAAELDNQVL